VEAVADLLFEEIELPDIGIGFWSDMQTEYSASAKQHSSDTTQRANSGGEW
jgi:hypothetical protein